MASNTCTIQIRWGDCDPAGIVFYPRYFEMFDACTAGLFQAITGMHKRRLLEHYGIVGFPMVDTGARFLVPNRFGDRITVRSSIARIGRSSFDVVHTVLCESGELSIEAYEKRVWSGIDPDTGRIRGLPLPDDLVALIGSNGEE